VYLLVQIYCDIQVTYLLQQTAKYMSQANTGRLFKMF